MAEQLPSIHILHHSARFQHSAIPSLFAPGQTANRKRPADAGLKRLKIGRTSTECDRNCPTFGKWRSHRESNPGFSLERAAS